MSQQCLLRKFKNCYIFSGPSGVGKTTIARIFANNINQGLGEPIEIDGASNNGVDNVRMIIDSSIERSLDSEYKIFIIDECHMITPQGWNAFLKCIEEPPKHTIFMFCTTEIRKIPQTIINRCQVHFLSRIDNSLIEKRLGEICDKENLIHDESSLKYISNLSKGSLRQAISYLDKCKDFSQNINLNNVVSCLGNYSYDIYFNLTNSIIDGNKENILNIIDKLYLDGLDLRMFIDEYLEFILQIVKYLIIKDIKLTTIPVSYTDQVDYLTNIEDQKNYFNSLLDKILNIKREIKNDSDIKTTIEVMLMRGGD